jgi:hypothetical protein
MDGLNLSHWTEEDLKSYQALDDCLSKQASWSGSTPEMIKLYRSLVWYSQVREKIKASIVSNVKISTPEQAPIAKKSKAKEDK